MLRQVQGALTDLKAVYASPDIQERLPAILANVQLATAHAARFSETLATISLQNQGNINQIAREIAGAATQLNRSAERVNQLVRASAPNIEGATARVARMVAATATNIEATTASVQRTGTRIEKLVDAGATDVEASTRIVHSMLQKTSGNLERTAEHVEKTTGYAEEASRTATADLAATVQRVRQLIEKSSGNLEQAAAGVEKATTSMAGLVEQSGKDIGESTRRVSEMVKASAGDVMTTSNHLAQLSASLHSDLAAATGRTRALIDKSAADIEATTGSVARLAAASSDDIMRTTRRIHDLLATSPLPTQLMAAGGHIERATANIEALTSDFRTTLGDPAVAGQIRGTVANLEKASGYLAAMSRESEGLVSDGRAALTKGTALVTDDAMWKSIRGTVSRLNAAVDDLATITAHGKSVLTSPQVTEDFTASIHNVRELTDRGAEVARKADASLTRVDQTMNRVQQIARQLQPSSTLGYAGVEAIDGFGLRADVVADLYFGEATRDYWRFGVRDFGDAETLTFQRGVGLASGATLRLGILGNKVGIGLDYPLRDRWSLELDAWNPNDPRLDVRGLCGVAPGWDLLLGANRVLGGTDPFIGLRRNFAFRRPPTGVAPATGIAPKSNATRP